MICIYFRFRFSWRHKLCFLKVKYIKPFLPSLFSCEVDSLASTPINRYPSCERTEFLHTCWVLRGGTLGPCLSTHYACGMCGRCNSQMILFSFRSEILYYLTIRVIHLQGLFLNSIRTKSKRKVLAEGSLLAQMMLRFFIRTTLRKNIYTECMVGPTCDLPSSISLIVPDKDSFRKLYQTEDT